MARVRKTVRFPIEQYQRLEAEAAVVGVPVGTWMSIKLEDSLYADRRQRRIETARKRLTTIRANTKPASRARSRASSQHP